MLVLTFLLGVTVCLQADSLPLASSEEKAVDLSHSCIQIHDSETHHLQDNAPVLLLHGIAASKESWKGIFQVIALQTGRRVCVADLRNHGDSPWSDSLDVEAMTWDISRFLDTINASKVVLLGHSLGGKVAVHFTLKHPEKVEKLIVEDMRPNGVAPEALAEVSAFLRFYLDAIKIVPADATEKEAKLAILNYINQNLLKLNFTDVLDDRVDVPIRYSDGKWTWKFNSKLVEAAINNITTMTSMLTPSSGRFDGPALFIYGKDSPFKVSEDEDNIRELFPKAEIVGVKGTGHTVHYHPEFLTSVIQFIQKALFTSST